MLPIVAAGLAAGASLLGQGVQNRMNRKAAERQYAHDIEMMKYQNEYNSPKEQMKRLKAANLNPMLVYGSGQVTGNLTGNVPQYREEPKRFDLAEPVRSGIGMYQTSLQTAIDRAQEDKILADTQLTKQQAMNAAIMNDILSTKNLKDAFDFSQLQKGADYNLEQKRLLVEKTGAEIENLYKGMELKDSELETKAINRRLIIATIAGKVQDTKKTQMIIKLMEKGWMPGDSYAQRKIGEALDELGINFQNATKFLNETSNYVKGVQNRFNSPTFWEDFKKYSKGGYKISK